MVDRARVRVTPPLVPMLAMAAGFAVHVLVPLPIGPSAPVRSAGLLLVILSIGSL